jgi:uncharacterized membrane protein YjfL (UPF0719 family)
MSELGLVAPFWVIVLIWLAKVVLLAFVATLLAWFGVLILDALTPHVSERQRIGEDPVAVGIFVAGFFIFLGLVIHGAVSALTAVTTPIVWYVFDFRSWGLLAISFLVSLLVGIAIFYIFDRLTPKIPFLSINRSPVAVGIFVGGYLVFFGLVLHAALTGPL